MHAFIQMSSACIVNFIVIANVFVFSIAILLMYLSELKYDEMIFQFNETYSLLVYLKTQN